MIVKFKKNTEPCVVYKVINGSSVIEFDEILNKYCPCIEIECFGLVAKELLTAAKEHPKNRSIMDLTIDLTNN